MFQPYYSGLVAVSSFRALDASPEVAANQLRAKASWDEVFDKIILFGRYDKRLASPKTEFIQDAGDFPSIALMVLAASWQEDPVCILNADIVVAINLKDIVNRGWSKQAQALTSKRYEFDPARENYNDAKVVDVGVDFFCAFPSAWKQVYKHIPGCFRISHQRWDQYMLAFFTHTFPNRFFDLTNHRPIFHPKHGDRQMPHHIAIPEDCFYEMMGFPPLV
jgi:hypothetical protein